MSKTTTLQPIETFDVSIFFSLILFSLATVSCSKKSGSENHSENKEEVIVYTYDSFTGEWGPGNAIAELFEKSTGCKVTFVDCGDAIQAYNRAVLERNNPIADIVLGIDNTLSDKAEKFFCSINSFIISFCTTLSANSSL